jgi:hypothetical protein
VGGINCRLLEVIFIRAFVAITFQSGRKQYQLVEFSLRFLRLDVNFSLSKRQRSCGEREGAGISWQ